MLLFDCFGGLVSYDNFAEFFFVGTSEEVVPCFQSSEADSLNSITFEAELPVQLKDREVRNTLWCIFGGDQQSDRRARLGNDFAGFDSFRSNGDVQSLRFGVFPGFDLCGLFFGAASKGDFFAFFKGPDVETSLPLRR